jgi:phosphatidylinositol alpha 1,6-mannosyltransferase
MDDGNEGPFRIGYVVRLAAEKGVRALARLERALLDMGHRDFRFVVVGEGAEEEWLRNHMRYAEFTGVLTGLELSRTFADFDVLAFPSETDTFGLVVLEAFAWGVPAAVTDRGGPQFTVRHEISGYIARDCDEFAAYTARLMSQPDLLSAMRRAAREQARATSWDRILKGCMKLTRAAGPPRRLRSTVFSLRPPADIPLIINPQASPLQESRPRPSVFSRLATALQVVKLL